MQPLSTKKNGSAERTNSHLFIVSAPSGAGKSTLCRAILNRFQDMRYSVSHTTRAPRKGEQDGVDYHFVSTEAFKAGIESRKWAEWAEVHGNFYGTSADFIDKGLNAGRDILLDIDVQGTLQILKRYRHAITFFILPPSLDVLKRRLEARGTDSPETIAGRLAAAEKEIARKQLYRHIIVNDRLAEAVSELVSVIESYTRKSPQNVIDGD